MKKTKGFPDKYNKMSAEEKEAFTAGFDIIENPTAKGIFNSEVLVFGLSVKDGSDFFIEDETIDEIKSLIDLGEFVFGTRYSKAKK